VRGGREVTKEGHLPPLTTESEKEVTKREKLFPAEREDWERDIKRVLSTQVNNFEDAPKRKKGGVEKKPGLDPKRGREGNVDRGGEVPLSARASAVTVEG